MSTLLDIDTIEITDEDVKEFLPDKITHIAIYPNDTKMYCGETQIHPCCAGDPYMVTKANKITSCIYCGTPICSYCLLLLPY